MRRRIGFLLALRLAFLVFPRLYAQHGSGGGHFSGGGFPYTDEAINQAYRAVQELRLDKRQAQDACDFGIIASARCGPRLRSFAVVGEEGGNVPRSSDSSGISVFRGDGISTA